VYLELDVEYLPGKVGRDATMHTVAATGRHCRIEYCSVADISQPAATSLVASWSDLIPRARLIVQNS
jgi:hypothetical protein